MTDYEAMWHKACEENKFLVDQNERLKGNKKENPTLRDQFAMAALTGLLARGERYDVTTDAYTIADSMMKERDGS